MDKNEMRQIAEEIARESPNASARVSALRFLRDLEGKDDEETRDSFAELDELASRRQAQ